MSLSVVKRPQGYVLDTTLVTSTSISTAGSDVVVTKNAHGLVTGDIIYVTSGESEFLGYWYVSILGVNTFNLREYATAANLTAILIGVNPLKNISWYKSVSTHKWNCVHLPIIYKLKSDIWPINGADTARTITTFSNYNGYTYIVASGDIKATGTASSLEQVVLSGTSVDGIYKIIQWFSDTNFVINLPYSAGNTLSSGTVQYNYYNYHARIKIFAGLDTSLSFHAKNDYVQVAEVRCVPDSTGVIILNIAEYVKKQINILTNDPSKYPMPHNLDAFCNFYITYAESYDDSNGYVVSQFTSSYTSDLGTYFGCALNAKLPFKTRSSGAMSQYVTNVAIATLGIKGKFLTAFTRPVLFPGKYFDISFLATNTGTGFFLRREIYLAGVLKDVQYDAIPAIGEGVYRMPISRSGWSEDRIDITVFNTTSSIALTETLTIDVETRCSFQDFYLVWLNYLGGFDYWNFTGRKKYAIDNLESKTQETNVFKNWPNSGGEFADTVNRNTLRRGKDLITVNTQFLSQVQEDAIKLAVMSPLVQVCTSQYDRRTVLIDSTTLKIRTDRDKSLKLQFGIGYTDELPSQSL